MIKSPEYFVQDKDVYLIDDIFSAVDGHVAAHIYRKVTKLMKKMMTGPSTRENIQFFQVVLGLLKEKTRVLCTHHTRSVETYSQPKTMTACPDT